LPVRVDQCQIGGETPQRLDRVSGLGRVRVVPQPLPQPGPRTLRQGRGRNAAAHVDLGQRHAGRCLQRRRDAQRPASSGMNALGVRRCVPM